MNTMTKPFLITLSLAFILLSCSEKKVLVMASGKITVEGNIVSAEEGTTHSEQDCTLKEASIVVKNNGASTDIPVNESGLYILNIKKDTIVGSYQRLSTDNSLKRLSQEDLQRSIDSLESLMKGLNVTAANRNFCIPPGKLSFITENTKAQVVGPYLKMPGSFEGGREYEIYKFYTNKEIREIIEKLRKLQG